MTKKVEANETIATDPLTNKIRKMTVDIAVSYVEDIRSVCKMSKITFDTDAIRALTPLIIYAEGAVKEQLLGLVNKITQNFENIPKEDFTLNITENKPG